jgi:cytochrome c553
VVHGGGRYEDLRTIEAIHGSAQAGAAKAAVCVSCHGADGEPVAPTFPRLAGQRADYLYHRLVSFKRADPKDPYYSISPMTSIAAGLSDADMRDLAAYFSAQASPRSDAPAAANPTAMAASIGETLFLDGDPRRGSPPCRGCHGADANGPDLNAGQYAAYPALRGQSAQYLMARLTNFRDGRPSDTTNAFIMHGVAATLDDHAIEAIASWLHSLQPVKSPRTALDSPASGTAPGNAAVLDDHLDAAVLLPARGGAVVADR